jgi:hypothetical protein
MAVRYVRRLSGVLDVIQKADVMRGQPVGSRTLAQQSDVAQRWFAVDVLPSSDVGDGLERPAGTAGGAMTGNKEIVLPAEAALTFKLQQPLEIK